MNRSHVWTLFRKEMTDILRDRRTLFLLFVMPLVVYPLVLVGLGGIGAVAKKRLDEQRLNIGNVNGSCSLSNLDAEHLSALTVDSSDAKSMLSEKTIDAFVECAPGEDSSDRFRIGYSQRFERSVDAEKRLNRWVKRLSDELLAKRLIEKGLPAGFATPLKVESQDVLTAEEDKLMVALAKTLPSLLLFILFLSTPYAALDVTAGEKERGTLETLLVTPVSPWQWMTAKFLAVFSLSMLSTVMQFGSMSALMQLVMKAHGQTLFSWEQTLKVFLCLLPAAVFASGICLAAASMARSFRESQNLMSPVILLATVPTFAATMPGVSLNDFTAWVPMLNVALLCREILLGTVETRYVVEVIVSILLFAVMAIGWAIKMFQSETFRFGGADSWSEVWTLWRRR